MRAVGLDIGERRVGIARTDETGVLAVPCPVYRRRALPEDVRFLSQFLREFGAEVLVVGLPLNMDGTEGVQAHQVREFAELLAETAGIPLEFVDERWTTQEVERVLREAGQQPGRQKEKVDALSAVLILQAWLDRKSRV